MTTIERARFEELLGRYWEIAFVEASGVTPTGNKANQVLHEIRAVFDAQSAEIDRLRKDAERRPMDREEMMDGYCNTPQFHQFVQAFEAGVLYAEAFHGIKGTP